MLICHDKFSLAFIWEQFHKKRTYGFADYTFKIINKSPGDKRVKHFDNLTSQALKMSPPKT